MTSATRVMTPTAVAAATAGSRFRIRIAAGTGEVAALWDRLGAEGIGTPFQTRPFVEAWFSHLGRRAEPLIVTGEDGFGGAFLLPLAVTRKGPARVAVFPGGNHANTNLGLFDPSVWARLDADDVAAVWAALATERPDVDLVALYDQPRRFAGRPNPFVGPRARPSPHNAFVSDLEDGFEGLLARHKGSKKRQKIRSRQRAIAPLGGYRAARCTDPAQALALLDVFFAQKAGRFHEMGVPDVFADAETRAFFRSLAAATGDDDAVLEVYGLTIGEQLVATEVLVVQGGIAYLLMNSFALDDTRRLSPGELVLFHSIEDYAARSFTGFDFGVGDARYKRSWCDREVDLAETVIPLTAVGVAAAGCLGAKRSLRDFVVARPALRRFVQRLRRRGTGSATADEGGAED